MSEGNAEIIERGYEAFNSRDLSRLGELLQPDFEVDLSNSMGFDRATYRGEEGLRRFFQSYWDAFEAISIELVELIGTGDAIVAIVRARGRGLGSGAEVDAVGPHLWSFREGRAVGLAFHQHLPDALEAAGLEEVPEAQSGAPRSPGSVER